MTVDEILKETKDWPADRLEELVVRLNQTLNANCDKAGIEKAWKEEVRRRLAQIDNGTVELVDGEIVSARIRKIVGR
jgi:hypothetical protein